MRSVETIRQKAHNSVSIVRHYYSIGIKENEAPKKIFTYFSKLNSICSYCYAYRYNTKVNHRWASGITLYISPEFNQEFALLKALAYLFDYYKRMAEKLRYEIWKYDREQKVKALYLPLPRPETWKEAA